MMTGKAHELGMSRTQYVNASGLPNAGQLTTAHDLAILGRAMQERFPRYFHFFSLPSFRYAGYTMRNHDHLLGSVDGVDGIKTGYTNASGYNLLTDVRRGGRHLVAVVLGGHTWRSRDRIMAGLIDAHIAEAAVGRGMAPVTEIAAREEIAPVRASAPVVAPVREPRAEPVIPVAELPPARPAPAVAVARPRPAVVAASLKIAETAAGTGSIPSPVEDGSTRSRAASGATPAPLRWVVGPQPARAGRAAALEAHAPVKLVSSHTEVRTAIESAPIKRSGVEIQIGATDDADQAKSLLAKAKTHGADALARATPFTQKVEKGGATLWRARFAGLDETQAEVACRQLKRSGFACFTIRD
jgi:D-alanyl-D-alanine carboxypeptidase